MTRICPRVELWTCDLHEVGALVRDAAVLALFVSGWWPGLEDALSWPDCCDRPEEDHRFQAAQRILAIIEANKPPPFVWWPELHVCGGRRTRLGRRWNPRSIRYANFLGCGGATATLGPLNQVGYRWFDR